MNTIQTYSTNLQKMARILARFAVRALYLEVKAYPKPGLVSFVCNGAHQDMNGVLFFRSLCSLRHYFYQLVLQDSIDSRFELLKNMATQAEARMLIATKGVNTHRGALFALGLMCLSTARLATKNPAFTAMDLQKQLIQDWKTTLSTHRLNHDSHGAQVYRKYNVIGAKQMAMDGYSIVFRVLQPFLMLFEAEKSLDVCCLYAYAEFLAEIDDTNIIYRKGIEGLSFAKQQAHKMRSIDCIHERRLVALRLHHDFSTQQISPGGVGDLIAVLLFVGQLFRHKPWY